MIIYNKGFEIGNFEDWNGKPNVGEKRTVGAIKCPDCEYEIEHGEPLYSPDKVHVYCPKCKIDLNNRPLRIVF